MITSSVDSQPKQGKAPLLWSPPTSVHEIDALSQEVPGLYISCILRWFLHGFHRSNCLSNMCSTFLVNIQTSFCLSVFLSLCPSFVCLFVCPLSLVSCPSFISFVGLLFLSACLSFACFFYPCSVFKKDSFNFWGKVRCVLGRQWKQYIVGELQGNFISAQLSLPSLTVSESILFVYLAPQETRFQEIYAFGVNVHLFKCLWFYL